LIVFIALVNVPDTVSKWARWAILSLIVGFPVSNSNFIPLMSCR
jgi:hypothetical protein